MKLRIGTPEQYGETLYFIVKNLGLIVRCRVTVDYIGLGTLSKIVHQVAHCAIYRYAAL